MLRKRLNVKDRDAQKVISNLLATFAGTQVVCQPLAGIIGDRMAHRKALLIGALFLAIAGSSILALTVHGKEI